MKLNGWTWLISGLIVAIISGYVYLFIPKNNSPNNAMALFFFIGIIFIVVGLLKVLFTRKEDDLMMNAVKEPERTPAQPINANTMQVPQNRVEQEINEMLKQQEQKQQATNPAIKQTNNINRTNHTNSFYNKYQYQGPVHQTHATHSTHPANTKQPAIANISKPTHIQNAEHGIRCKSCSNINSAHSNYCHKCGHRLN